MAVATRIRTLFWDLGGVLLTNGWDSDQRAAAVERFDLEPEEFEDRHREVVAALETGRCTLEDYLRQTVFHRPRPFDAGEFRAFMESQSEAYPENLAVVDRLAASGGYRLATLNNESRELNLYRIERFGLRRRFDAFFTSSFVGVMKPSAGIYRIALEVTQSRPDEALFVDDREQNVEAARAAGMRAVRFRAEEGAGALGARLEAEGVTVEKGLGGPEGEPLH